MKPMLFNTEMVRALLAGRKTVTRRVIKPQPLSKLAYCCMGYKHGTWSYPSADAWKNWDDESFRLPDKLTNEDKVRRWTPPCHTGDILYVRETWCWCPCWDCGMDTEEGCADETAEKLYHAEKSEWGCYGYKASFADNEAPFGDGWNPSIHMPREAARLFLRVTDVRVERLQDITDEQAEKEGCNDYTSTALGFFDIWDSTIKPADRALYGWYANPWVWVIEFERISKEKAGV